MPKDKSTTEKAPRTTTESLKATPELNAGLPPEPSISLVASYEDITRQSGLMCAKFEKEWKGLLEGTNSIAPNEITNKLLNRTNDADMSLGKLMRLISAARTKIARQRDRYNEVLNLSQRLASEMPDDDMEDGWQVD